jgi:hypothetical protein
MGFFSDIGNFFENVGSEAADFVQDPIGGLGDAGQYVIDSATGGGVFDDLGVAGAVLFPGMSGYDYAGAVGLPSFNNQGVLTGGGLGQLAPYAAAAGLASGQVALPAFLGIGATSGVPSTSVVNSVLPSPVSTALGTPAPTTPNLLSAQGVINAAAESQGISAAQALNLASLAATAGLQAYGGAQLAEAQQDFQNADREDKQAAALELQEIQNKINKQQFAANLQTQLQGAQANAALAKQRLVQQAFSQMINNSLSGGTGTANALGNLASLGQRALG